MCHINTLCHSRWGNKCTFELAAGGSTSTQSSTIVALDTVGFMGAFSGQPDRNLSYNVFCIEQWTNRIVLQHARSSIFSINNSPNYHLGKIRTTPRMAFDRILFQSATKDEQSKHECDVGCVVFCWDPAGNYSSGLQYNNTAIVLLKGSSISPNTNGDECGFWMAASGDFNTKNSSTRNCFLCMSNKLMSSTTTYGSREGR